ncbi:hypothetical protein Agub_g12368 [Astrephomene gubernaculifera]|uniref:J domain-containing protein n=1 Tax=Astrephomene gubernaculifera TaxID=47775 RepID=A0AAD3DY50_9CHLO|nr:hypothetical protein Agub_g12368 [Astrephomene gubernaculifera]
MKKAKEVDPQKAEEAAAARRRAKNARKAAKRSAKRAERREFERVQQEEQEEAARAYRAYVAAAEARFNEAKAADNPSSRSNQLRDSANKLYRNLEGVAPVLLQSQLSRTEGLYRDALSTASTPLERCAAAKNLAVLSRRTLTLTRADGPTALQLQADALGHYARALIWGSECQTIAWMDDLFSAASQLVDSVLSWKTSELVRERPFLAAKWPDQGAVLHKLYSCLPLASSSSERSGHLAGLKASLALTLAKHLYGEALRIQEVGRAEQDWRRALDLVLRVQPLFAAAAHNARRAGDSDMEEEAESLVEAADIGEAICRSVQARHAADALLKRVLQDSESLDMEGIRLVADMYQEAVALARGCDLECEARAHRSLGHLYSTVLRMRERGLKHYKHVLDLGVAMMPRVVNDTDWYQEARRAVLQAQQEQAAAEERQAAASRAPFLEQLKEELAAVSKAAVKGSHELLRHIYRVHPPGGGSEPVSLPPESLLGDKIKDTLRRAIIAYHPDKQVTKPRRWQVLAEEITKELTLKYECMKG